MLPAADAVLFSLNVLLRLNWEMLMLTVDAADLSLYTLWQHMHHMWNFTILHTSVAPPNQSLWLLARQCITCSLIILLYCRWLLTGRVEGDLCMYAARTSTHKLTVHEWNIRQQASESLETKIMFTYEKKHRSPKTSNIQQNSMIFVYGCIGENLIKY